MVYTVVPNELYPTIESRFSVYLGVNNETIKDKDQNAIRVPVAFIAVHPEYNLDDRMLNDIAIIKLAWEVELNDNIQLACLPDPNIPGYPTKYGIDAFATGWGSLDEAADEYPDQLQNVILEILDPDTCPKTELYDNDWNTQICSGYLAGEKDTCYGIKISFDFFLRFYQFKIMTSYFFF